MEILFEKLHGNGNDFILIDEMTEVVIPEDLKAEFAAQYCQRHFGIGSDGVLFLSRTEGADLKMRLFQPDRSEAEMCGNGIRCLAKYAVDAGYVRDSCKVETRAGIIPVRMGYQEDRFLATVDMPSPAFEREKIPATGEGEYHETIEGMDVRALNVGVPHAVVLVDSVESIDVETVGPKIRYHETFPEGTNVDFVEIVGENALQIRTYERGIETESFSCGTGATAAAAMLHRMGKVGEIVQVETNGGPLIIHLKEGALMEGPVETVFVGAIPV